jgi:hypothetical protein
MYNDPKDASGQETAQDFTSEPIEPEAPPFRAVPYDPRPQEDSARRRIAYLLLAILAVMILAAIVLVILWPERLDSLLKLYQLIFTPVVALVSAATGFYYGTKSKSRSKQKP